MLKILINPFEKYAEKPLFLFGLAFLFIGSYLGFLFNTKFDSILHISPIENSSLISSMVQNLLIIFLLTIVLFLLGKYYNTKTRFVDILNVSLISRIPFYFSTLLNINNLNKTITDKLIKNVDTIQNLNFTTFEYLFLFIVTIIGLLTIIWFAILIWNGFKTATNAKTKKEIILFSITLIITNFISAYIIHLIN